MEFIVVLVVIIVLCKVLGVSNGTLLLCGMGLVGLVIAAMFLFFVYFCFRLITAKRKKGRFTRFLKQEKAKFTSACYEVDGEELPCVFPKESLSGSNTYSTEKEYTLFYSRRMKKVFDMWSVLTCIIGLIFSTFSLIIALYVTLWTLRT